MAIELNMSPTAKALIVLAIGYAVINIASAKVSTWLLTRPKLQVIQQPAAAPVKVTKASEIHIIREDGPGPKTTGVPTDGIRNELFTGEIPTNTSGPADDHKQKATDYFAQLQTGGVLRIDALTSNGAIINGDFVAIGGTIDQFSYPARGEDENNPNARTISPKLTSVTTNSITITESVAPRRAHTFKFD